MADARREPRGRTWYAAWSRLLFSPGFALFIGSAMAPTERTLLSRLPFMGSCVGIIIWLVGLPVLKGSGSVEPVRILTP